MSGSEPITSGRESYGVGVEKSSGMPNMRLAFSADGSAVYKPVVAMDTSSTYQTSGSGGGGGGSTLQPNLNLGGEPLKRKRGRPRKYGSEDSKTPPSQPPSTVLSGGFPSSPPPSVAPSSLSSTKKKGRGRPPGSGCKQQGSAGVGFTPHVITVKAGEDVSDKIMSFSQNGPRSVCILSANGAISNVTLHQAATSGGTVTYEGRFEILNLCGSFLASESGGQRSRSGGLSVSLAGPDGRVLGGGVAGLLTAASLVQVVIGSFMAEGASTGKEAKSAKALTSTKLGVSAAPGGGGGGGNPPPRPPTLSESSGSPLNAQSSGANSQGPQFDFDQ